MTDITKCLNKNCPIKKSCYRYTAPSSTYQSVSMFNFIMHKEKSTDPYITTCEGYWENRTKKGVK